MGAFALVLGAITSPLMETALQNYISLFLGLLCLKRDCVFEGCPHNVGHTFPGALLSLLRAASLSFTPDNSVIPYASFCRGILNSKWIFFNFTAVGSSLCFLAVLVASQLCTFFPYNSQVAAWWLTSPSFPCCCGKIEQHISCYEHPPDFYPC